MIRTLMATTALATLLATLAMAQDTTAPAPAQPAVTDPANPAAPVARADGNLASMMIGETVYNGTADDAENIGEVNDIVIGANGQVESVIIGVGGFLGLGEKNVAVNFTDVTWAEKDGDRWLVVPATKDQLTAQAEFDRRAYEPAAMNAAAPAPAATDTMAAAPADPNAAAPAPAEPEAMAAAPAPAEPDAMADAPAPATDTTAAAPAADPNASAMAPATDTTQTAAIDRSTLTEIPAGDLRAEELVGTTVYGANDANVGEIGDVVMSQDGKADAVIIDVGGFLGMGEKEVAVGFDKLQFMTDKDGNKYLYTTFSKEQLEAQTAYDKSTWAEQRDQQRLMVQ